MYQVADSRKNAQSCPISWPAKKDLITKTFKVTSTSVLVVTGHSIRKGSGRHDFYLLLNGGTKDLSVTYTSSNQWEDAWVHWIGEVRG